LFLSLHSSRMEKTQRTGLQVIYRNNDIRQLVRKAAVTTRINGFNRRRLFQRYGQQSRSS
jgi:hypothetical protein